MITLNELTLTLNKNRWALVSSILGLAFLVVVIYSFSAKRQGAQPPSPTPPTFPVQTITTVQFSKDNLTQNENYSRKLPIYTVTDSPSLVTNSGSLSQKLGFNSQPQDLNDISQGRGLIYENKNGSLVIYPSMLTFQKYGTDQTAGTQDVSFLHQKAIDFISSLGLSINFSSNPSVTYSVARGEFQEKTTDSQKANLTTITLSYELSGVPVIFERNQTTVTFNSSGDITKLVYAQFPSVKEESVYPVAPAQAALQQLLSGKGSLINLSTQNNYEGTPQTIKNINLESQTLAYYLENKATTIQPIWIFLGTSDAKAEVKYAVPAIPQAAN